VVRYGAASAAEEVTVAVGDRRAVVVDLGPAAVVSANGVALEVLGCIEALAAAMGRIRTVPLSS
jgi:hypothetical protein